MSSRNDCPLRNICNSNANWSVLFDVDVFYFPPTLTRFLPDLTMRNMEAYYKIHELIARGEYLGSSPVFVFLLYFGFCFCLFAFVFFIFFLGGGRRKLYLSCAQCYLCTFLIDLSLFSNVDLLYLIDILFNPKPRFSPGFRRCHLYLWRFGD